MGRAARAEAALPGERVVDVIGVRKRWQRGRWFARRSDAAKDVLIDLSLSVDRGEIVVVLGENGAGKTTLLKIIGGLARADEGCVRVLGYDAGVDSPALRSRVAYAGGERGFYFRLSARENLAFFAALDGLSAADRVRRIAEVARTVDIEADLDRRFADLSTGIRQRLAIARALLADPEVLLLDEPTRALDPPHATRLRRFVRDTLAGKHGKTIVVATNLIDEAIELGDRIAVLRAARLEFIAPAGSLPPEDAIRALFGMPADA